MGSYCPTPDQTPGWGNFTEVFKLARLPGRLLPIPSEASSGCGLSLVDDGAGLLGAQ